MSYLVLARKYRPRNFTEMAGQDHVLRALVNALDGDRLHHAFLFAGMRGVGKTTVARILAKAINCEQGVTSKPCGECRACREIDEGRFVDLIEVDAASRTRVDDTRELLDNVQYAPTRGRFKVYLIDEVHMLSAHSFNALLKTLEEPPPHVKFLLATTDPQKLPVTVLSRCLQFNLKRLPTDLIEKQLARIAEAEGSPAEPAALKQLARAAEGSMRDALSLLDQSISFGGGKLTAADVRSLLGSISREYVANLVQAIAAGDGRLLLEHVASMDEQAPDYEGVLDELARLLQQVALAQVVPEALGEDSDDSAAVLGLARALAAEDVQLYYQIALIGRRDLPLAPDPRSGFEMVVLRMLAFRPDSAATGADSGSAPEDGTSARRAATGQAGETSGEPTGELFDARAASPGRSDWEALVNSLPLQGAARQLAVHCVLTQSANRILHLQLDRQHEHLLTPQQQARLERALASHYGQPVKVRIHTGRTEAETPARRQARQDDERLRAARESIERDPNVRALRETLGAVVQPDSIEPLNPK